MKLSILLAVRISRYQYFKFLLQSYALNSNKPHVLSVNRKFILSRLSCCILISFQLKHKFSIFFWFALWTVHLCARSKSSPFFFVKNWASQQANSLPETYTKSVHILLTYLHFHFYLRLRLPKGNMSIFLIFFLIMEVKSRFFLKSRLR